MPNREMKVQIARRTSSREFSISFWLQLAYRVVCEFLVITLESCVCNYPFLTFFDVFWFYFEMDLYGTKRQAVVLLCTIEGEFDDVVMLIRVYPAKTGNQNW